MVERTYYGHGCVLYLNHMQIEGPEGVVLEEAHLMVKRSERVALVGPNGSGKSTLLKALCGVLKSGWSIQWHKSKLFGRPIPSSEAQWHALRGKRLAYMPQDGFASFVPRRTLLSQIQEICKAIELPWEEGLKRSQSLAKSLDLDWDSIYLYPQELSGGMIQRVALLVALLPQPELLLVDEPTAALDLTRQIVLVELLKKVTKETGCALLFVTHQKELLTHLGGRIYEIKDKKLQLLADEGAQQFHIGRSVKEKYVKEKDINAEDIKAKNINMEDIKAKDINAEDIKEEDIEAADIKAEDIIVNHGDEVERFTKQCLPDKVVRPLLHMKDISISYTQGKDRFEAVKQVNLSVMPGEWVGLIGPSGAGKSSLFKVACGLYDAYEGCIEIKGQNIRKLTLAQLGQIMQPIFQQPQSAFHPKRTLEWSLREVQGATIEGEAEAALGKVLLSSTYKSKYITEFSGGEGQRAAIARALMSGPELLLCDEITSALDPHTAEEIIAYLQRVKGESNVSGLIITHDLEVVRSLCSRMYVMDHHEIVETGEVASLLNNPQSDTLKKLLEAFHYVNRQP